MARMATRTIALVLAALGLPATAVGQAASDPPSDGAGLPPDRVVVIGPEQRLAQRPRGLGEALASLHAFLGAQAQAAGVLTMNPSSPAVADLATNLADDFNELELELAALGQQLGMDLEAGGPLGATETARTWAQEQRRLELEALRGGALDAAFLAPLPDEMRFGLGLVNAAKLSGTLDPEVLRFLNGTGLQLQSYLDRSRGLLAPRIRVATAAERARR